MLFSASCNSFLWLSASQIFSIWCSFWIIFGSSFHCRDRSVKCSPSFLTVLVDIDQSLHSDVWISNHIRRQNGWTMMNYVIMFVTLCHIMSHYVTMFSPSCRTKWLRTHREVQTRLNGSCSVRSQFVCMAIVGHMMCACVCVYYMILYVHKIVNYIYSDIW